VPLDVDIEELVGRRGYVLPTSRVEEVFRRFEFGSLVRRVQEMARTGDGAESAASAAPVAASAPAAPPVAAPPAERVAELLDPHSAGAAPPVAVQASRPAATDAAAPTDHAAQAELPAPRLVIEEGVGALAALLEQKEAALAFAPVTDGDGATTCAAVFNGGEAVVAARIGEQVWHSLWLLAAHVIGHDVKSFPHFATAPAGPAFDTAIAAYLLAPERPVIDLFELARVAADERLVDGPQDEAAAATRAVLTWQLAERQRGPLLDVGVERLFREIELPLARVLARMEAVGVRMDPYRLGEITARVRDSVDETRDRIYQLAGEEFNIGSPAQLADVLFVRLSLAPARRGKTGFSTDARVLRTLRDEHPIVAAVEEWREHTKLLNTYLETLPERLDPTTGRLHTTFNQMVTTTGRLSSSNPNLQNIPVRTELGGQIRACFVAEEGWRLIVADYSQIELRLMAHIAQEPALLDAFRRGEDVHRTTAAAVAGIAPEEVTAEQRQRAKATNFGIMYGLSAFGLAEQVGISREEARDFINAYFARYPKVREFRDETIGRATDDGYVTTLFGRRRAMPELRSGNQRERGLGERLAVNTVLQGSAADIIKVAMIRVSDELERRKLDARLVLQVHDELIFEAPVAEADEVATLAREAMCGAYVIDPPIEVSVGVGENWRDAK
jgi:DNA polymerase-1